MHQAKAYLNYWLDCVDEHSLHSPFLFDLYSKVIRPDPSPIIEYENLRAQLLKDNRSIDVLDLGAGSKHATGTARKVSAIAQTSLSDVRYSCLYARLMEYFKARTVVELGTSFGINTLYLAHTPGSTVYTFEGAPAICEIAELTFEFARSSNIKLIPGDISQTLYSWLSNMPKVDFAFLDANHRYEPTRKYFEWLLTKSHHKSIFVLDDIHDSAEMERAWNELRNHELVYTSIDLFRCGILFFDPSLIKQHVVLRFPN